MAKGILATAWLAEGWGCQRLETAVFVLSPFLWSKGACSSLACLDFGRLLPALALGGARSPGLNRLHHDGHWARPPSPAASPAHLCCHGKPLNGQRMIDRLGSVVWVCVVGVTRPLICHEFCSVPSYSRRSLSSAPGLAPLSFTLATTTCPTPLFLSTSTRKLLASLALWYRR